MARNMVQFKKGQSLPDFMKQYGSEGACRQALFKLCWPSGFRCPECGHHSHCRLKTCNLIQCNRCHHQTSLIARTIFANIKNVIHGIYHSLYGKHLGRYLGEFAYRFNRRFALERMVERLVYVAARTPPLPYSLATMAEIHA